MAAAVSWAAACLCSAATGAEETETSPEADARHREEQAIDVLLNGTPEERLAIADHLSSNLDLNAQPGDGALSLDDLTDDLILALRQEQDDWIARTLLKSLQWRREPELNRLRHEALALDSVNLQATAIEHYQFYKDDEAIESLWKRDIPGWLRPRLLGALGNQGSIAYLGNFMRLTRDDDPDLRHAAIEALGELARDESIPTLIRVLHEGTKPDRATALEALGAFPDSEEALREVLEASQSLDNLLLSSAVRALGRFHSPDAGTRLIGLLDSPPDPELRGNIARALESSTHPDATAALVRLLHQPDVTPGSWIAASAIVTLRNRDDLEAVPMLRDLVSPPVAGTQDPLDDLIAYLSRDRSDGRRSYSMSSRCGSRAISPDDPDAYHVTPYEPFETIRCWDGPERPGSPDVLSRLRAATLARVFDYFERPHVTWVEIVTATGESCWVPLDQLAKGGARPEPLSWPRSHLRVEVDLDVAEIDSARAARLKSAGILSVFEPGGEVEGVALELDATNRDLVALVAALASPNRDPLDLALAALLSQGLDPDLPGGGMDLEVAPIMDDPPDADLVDDSADDASAANDEEPGDDSR
jgi:hypothetical protein